MAGLVRQVRSAQESCAPVADIGSRVVASGKPAGAKPLGVFEADAELDLAIAGDVRVRGATGGELVEEMAEDPVAVFGGEVDRVQRDVEFVSDPASVPRKAPPPPVFIEEVRVDQELLAPDPTSVLPAGHKSFELRYTALSFSSPSKVRFRYKLEGFDGDWVQAGTRRVAYYTSVPPRPYRFHVIAGNADGVWNDTGATFSFALAAPFSRRPPFWAAVVAAAAALALTASTGCTCVR